MVVEFLVACEFIASTAPPRPVPSLSSDNVFLGRVTATYVIQVRNHDSMPSSEHAALPPHTLGSFSNEYAPSMFNDV